MYLTRKSGVRYPRTVGLNPTSPPQIKNASSLRNQGAFFLVAGGHGSSLRPMIRDLGHGPMAVAQTKSDHFPPLSHCPTVALSGQDRIRSVALP